MSKSITILYKIKDFLNQAFYTIHVYLHILLTMWKYTYITDTNPNTNINITIVNNFINGMLCPNGK